MAEITIGSFSLHVSVGTLGAELLSLRGPDGAQQMWSGDPSVWGRRGPVIFPMLGGWPKGYYTHGGHRYAMDKNGFARLAEFRVLRQKADLVELELRDDAATWKQYPFAFRLLICYHTIGENLVINQSLTNLSNEPMPGALGMHPGFAWDRSRKGSSIRFSCPQTLRAFHPDGVWYDCLKDQDTVALTPSLFASGAISMEHPSSKWVELRRPDGDYDLRIYHSDYAYLTLWSMDDPRANFLCIEPSDSVGTDGDTLMDRRGMKAVAPGDTISKRITIALIPKEGVGNYE